MRIQQVNSIDLEFNRNLTQGCDKNVEIKQVEFTDLTPMTGRIADR